MTCDLETGGGRRTIEFRKRGSKWEMTLDGRILSVDVTASAGRWSLLIGSPSPEAPAGLPARGATRSPSSGARMASGSSHVNGLAVPVSIVDPRERLVRRRGSASDEAGPRSIVSPMPGRIVKVLVREGDAVAAQQGLVVVEAMKMENELRAPRAGQVSEVVEGVGRSERCCRDGVVSSQNANATRRIAGIAFLLHLNLHSEFQATHRPVPPSGDSEGARHRPPRGDRVRGDSRGGGRHVGGGGRRAGAEGARRTEGSRYLGRPMTSVACRCGCGTAAT